MTKRMIEEWSDVIEVVTQIITAVSLAVLAGVAVMMWKGGGLSLGSGVGSADTAQAPVAAPEEITQLTDDQWQTVIKGGAAEKGSANAKVTMVEFTDYQCPFCGRYYTDTYSQIVKNYVDTNKIRYITRDLPLPFHPNALPAAQIARCAGDQKKYFEMHGVLFSKQDDWANEADPKAKFESYAKEIGINSATAMKCLADGKYKDAVDADATLASTVGASGTPTFIVNGKVLVGAQPYAEFQRVIDAALAE